MRATGPDAVQKRPGMYIGNTADGSGLHAMVYEVASNAVAEALAGHADRIDVTLNPDGSCTVRDNGRGIPIDIHRSAGVSAAEVIMTHLLPVRQSSYKGSGGFRGVGVIVVNALSEWLDLRIWRDGGEHFMRFRLGVPEAALAVTGTAEDQEGKPWRGTEVTFLPSTRFFKKTEFDFATLERGLRGLKSINSSLNILLADRRRTEKK